MADPFASGSSNFLAGLKWLKSRIDQGKVQRSAGDSAQNFGGPAADVRNPSQATGYANSQQSQQFDRSSNERNGSFFKANTLIQITIAIIVAAIPITFYLAQPKTLEKAIVSVGEEVVDKANSAIRGGAQVFNDTEIVTEQRLDQTQQFDERSVSGAIGMPRGTEAESIAQVMDDSAMEHAAKHANPNYVCPMHPDVVTDDPNAICPICGMDLVLLEAGGDSGIVNLTPTVINSLGVRTAKAKRRTLYRRIDSVGYINVNENHLRTISLRTDGWVERLAVKTEGERVTKGQLLLEIYSPKLVNAQEEYLQATNHNNELLVKASRDRLVALGVSEEQILTLEDMGEAENLVKVYSPQSGIVSKLNVREGMYVKPSQNILNLVDLASVWLMVDVFERQADWVKVGQRAEATLPFIPGKSWEGQVEYVYPSLDASTRSLKVRLRFDNVDEQLKPNMYADVTIYAKPKKKVLSIPREALIRTGNEKRVIVALGEGKFIPMSVGVGMETDDRIEITRGLAEGDEVVTSSQFLIDSESSLKAALAKMVGG